MALSVVDAISPYPLTALRGESFTHPVLLGGVVVLRRAGGLRPEKSLYEDPTTGPALTHTHLAHAIREL